MRKKLTERKEVLFTKAQFELIQRASNILGVTTSKFIRDAARLKCVLNKPNHFF